MRIAIREQLALLVIFATLVALAIVTIPVWIFVNNFVVGVQQNALSLTASLKAARIRSEIDLLQSICLTISTRVLIQRTLIDFYGGNNDSTQWTTAANDISTALSTAGAPDLFQARIYSRNTTGDRNGLMNVTSEALRNQSIPLPYNKPDGQQALLANTSDGYPPALYPNITYIDTNTPSTISPDTNVFAAWVFKDVRLTNNALLLGPIIINESFALISLTVPIRGNSNNLVLGYMTLVSSASSLLNIQSSQEGLGETGMTLIIGPHTQSNLFNRSDPASQLNGSCKGPDADQFRRHQVQFVLPPNGSSKSLERHSQHNFASGNYDEPWTLGDYPAVAESLVKVKNRVINNAEASLWAKNEQNVGVSVGTARPNTTFVDWVVVVEQDRSEALAAIVTLRNILLASVFGAAGLMALIVFPCAHLSVRPIRELKVATEKSIAPPGYDPELPSGDASDSPASGVLSSLSEKGWIGAVLRKTAAWRKRRRPRGSQHDEESSHRRTFRIPGKVADRHHYVTDELTELTTTFNEMSDELLRQYTSLDEKVAERTRELEQSKKAAEAANESKTLFIANISHELKTPLNGIMGMASVCMEESDINRIKKSLNTLYKSGDLLLHLLEDLLSFSKNQIGHRIGLEEKEFRLGDIRHQLLSIFDKQVRESGTLFTVDFVASESIDTEPSGTPGPDATTTGSEVKLPALGPPGMGRLKDMSVWGDQHRILQVIINLVSNSLKFTPAGGQVKLRIRCVGELEHSDENSRPSSVSRSGSGRGGRSRFRRGTSSVNSGSTRNVPSTAQGSVSADQYTGTALAINPAEPKSATHMFIRERSPTPPPPGAKTFMFEFEVEDSGPGIPEHMRHKVFEPFVQGDVGLNKKFGGTGLGLSICQQLATLMNGTMLLRSVVGVGSTFTMRIPLKSVRNRAPSTSSSSIHSRSASVEVDGEKRRLSTGKTTPSTTAGVEAKPPAPSEPGNKLRLVGLSLPFFTTQSLKRNTNNKEQNAEFDRAIAEAAAKKGSKLRVLVADDNLTNVEVVCRMLNLEHVSDVTVAMDGQQAVEIVKANIAAGLSFDIIFMDIQMPNLDGLQSTRQIRGMGYRSPIIALSAFSEESNVKECIESGMDEFLAKPIRRPALKQVLRKFATIWEEPETAPGSTKKSTKPTPEAARTPQNPEDGEKPLSAAADTDSKPIDSTLSDEGAHASSNGAVKSDVISNGVPTASSAPTGPSPANKTTTSVTAPPPAPPPAAPPAAAASVS